MLSSKYQDLVRQNSDFKLEAAENIEHFFQVAKLWKTSSENLCLYREHLNAQIQTVEHEIAKFDIQNLKFSHSAKELFSDYLMNLVDVLKIPSVQKNDIKDLLEAEIAQMNETNENLGWDDFSYTLLELIKSEDKSLYSAAKTFNEYLLGLCGELEFKFEEYKEQLTVLKTQLAILDDRIKSDIEPISIHTHSTDFHGSASSFVSSLIESGVARFVQEEPEVIFFNISTNTTYKTLEEATANCKDIRDVIPIFNLELNPDFNGVYTFGGDLVDRDPFSVNLYCSMLNLVIKSHKVGKDFYYLIGNHEGMLMDGDPEGSILNGFNTCYLDGTESNLYIYKKLSESLKRAVAEEKIKMCHQIPGTNTLVSHVVYTRDNLIAMLDKIIKPFESYDAILMQFIAPEYFEGATPECLEELKNNLIENHHNIITLREKLVAMDTDDSISLTTEEISFMTHIVNTFGKIYFLATQESIRSTLSPIVSWDGFEYSYDSFTETAGDLTVHIKVTPATTGDEKPLGLLWNRSLITTGVKETVVDTNYKKVNGVLFVVGHDAYAIPGVLRSENVVYCDTLQCKFYREGFFGMQTPSASFFITNGDGEYRRISLVPEVIPPFNIAGRMRCIIDQGRLESAQLLESLAPKQSIRSQSSYRGQQITQQMLQDIAASTTNGGMSTVV